MKEKLEIIIYQINELCKDYYFSKQYNVLGTAKNMLPNIQDFMTVILSGNNFELSEDEYEGLKKFTIDLMEDIVSALENEDVVLIIDSFDYGLRTLVDIFLN